MKKVLVILGLIMVALLTMGGCKVETSTSFGLTIEDAFFGEPGPEGKPVPADDVFKRGEKVDFVLQNVGEFKKGDDGLNWFDLDLEVKDSSGEVVFLQQGLMGANGHVNIQNNILPSPYGTFAANMEPGDYTVKLTIYDKVSGGRASKSKPFTVE